MRKQIILACAAIALTIGLAVGPLRADAGRIVGGGTAVFDTMYCKLTGCTMTGAITYGVGGSSLQTFGGQLFTAGAIRADGGFYAGGVEYALTSAGVRALAGSAAAALYQQQTAIITAFVGGVADAVGEVAVRVGSMETDGAGAVDSTLLSVGTDIDGTPSPKFDVLGNGHLRVTGIAPSSYTTGTCSAESGTGDDTHGTVTATCTAQTWIVTFGKAFIAAPTCVITSKNTAASAGAASFQYTTSTTVLTATVTTATTGGQWSYICFE